MESDQFGFLFPVIIPVISLLSLRLILAGVPSSVMIQDVIIMDTKDMIATTLTATTH